MINNSAACAAALALMLSSAAQAADVATADAKITNGKLVITGKTVFGGIQLRLDGQTQPGFTVTSNASTKVFNFSVVYLPSDCIASLQKVNLNNTLGPSTDIVVANCGARGLSPRGAWVASTPYLANDLVTYDRSSWLAKRNNTGKNPSANPADWLSFAAKGEIGPAGPRGEQGVQGEQGEPGQQGSEGAIGPAGPTGAQGEAGPAGEKGDPGPQGDPGAQGPGVTVGGSWDADREYAVNDLALYGGSTWRALRPNENIAPDAGHPDDWEVFAQKGDTGDAGPQGNIGPQGPAGPQGPQGETGPQGAQGSPGSTGAQGPQGATGANGAQGIQGVQGATGPAGTTGQSAASGGLFIQQSLAPNILNSVNLPSLTVASTPVAALIEVDLSAQKSGSEICNVLSQLSVDGIPRGNQRLLQWAGNGTVSIVEEHIVLGLSVGTHTVSVQLMPSGCTGNPALTYTGWVGGLWGSNYNYLLVKM